MPPKKRGGGLKKKLKDLVGVGTSRRGDRAATPPPSPPPVAPTGRPRRKNATRVLTPSPSPPPAADDDDAVSYTHLTLPTKRIV